VRPYTHSVRELIFLTQQPYWFDLQGEDGFLITTWGECLTDVSTA